MRTQEFSLMNRTDFDFTVDCRERKNKSIWGIARPIGNKIAKEQRSVAIGFLRSKEILIKKKFSSPYTSKEIKRKTNQFGEIQQWKNYS